MDVWSDFSTQIAARGLSRWLEKSGIVAQRLRFWPDILDQTSTLPKGDEIDNLSIL